MSLSQIKILAYLYLILPLFIFCLTWFVPLIQIVLIIFLGISCCFIRFQDTKEMPFHLSKKTGACILLIAAFWCFWSGIGGYIHQTGDFLARNAIYHDLIERDYPIYYTAGFRTLNYYFGFWLIPAQLTKLFSFLHSPERLFTIGLNILLLYTILGVFLFYGLLISLIKPQTKKGLFLTLLFPIFFSGLDFIPALLNNTPFDHIEIWNGIGNIQYDCMTTQLFWVFNQALPAWIATMLFLDEKAPHNYGILFVATLFQGSLPTIGLGIFMFVAVIKFWRIAPRNTTTYQQIFSYSNIFAIPLLLTLISFLTCNTIAHKNTFHLNDLTFIRYYSFCMIEFVCYILPIYITYKHETNFKVMLVSLLTLVLFSIGGEFNDFPMRTSIPALLILQIYVLKFLLSADASRFNKKILCMFLAIGIITPAVEFSRGIRQIAENKTIYHRLDEWQTLNAKMTIFPWDNYLLSNYQHLPFYKYFVKPYQR